MATGGYSPPTETQNHRDIKTFLPTTQIDKDDDTTDRSTEACSSTLQGDDVVMTASKDKDGHQPHIVPCSQLHKTDKNHSEDQQQNTQSKDKTFNETNQQKMTSYSKEEMKPSEFETCPQAKDQELMIVSPQSLYKEHILKGDAIVHMNSCAAITSSIGDCDHLKNSMIEELVLKSIKIRNKRAPASPLMEKFMKDSKIFAHRELIVLGQPPYEHLSWSLKDTETATTTYCLLTYLANTCKRRGDDHYDKLQFHEQDCTADPEKVQIYEEIKLLWKHFKTNENLQEAIPAGISLINVLNIGSSKAAQAFLPFLNKYCKRSIHLVWCNDKDMLKKQLKKPATEHSMSTQFIKQLKGCLNEQQCVLLTEITDSSKTTIDDPQGNNNDLRIIIREKTGIEKIKHLKFPLPTVHSAYQAGKNPVEEATEDDKLKETRKFLEQVVVHAPFHTVAYLREIFLLQIIRKTNRFWMKRSEIELLSRKVNFINGNLDRFLLIYTAIGSIFHTHDIPALDDYVITDLVGFIKRVHQLYENEQESELAKYGLFRYTKDEDIQTIFKFLTTLGIAVKVNSTEIRKCLAIAEDQTYMYCYIPSLRSQKDPPATTNNEDMMKRHKNWVTISFNRCIAESPQACFCHELLIMGGRLVPTENCNTTVMTFCDEDQVQITDYGKDVEIAMLQDPSKPHKSIEVLSKVLLNYPSIMTQGGFKLRYQIVEVSGGLEQTNDQFIDAIQEIKHSCSYLNDMIPSQIGYLLANQYKDDMNELVTLMTTELYEINTPDDFQSTIKKLIRKKT